MRTRADEAQHEGPSAWYERIVLAMANLTLHPVLVFVLLLGAQLNSGRDVATQAICEAAASKLREAGSTKVVLFMTIDRKGQVESFKTVSPAGLNLEKMKPAARAINSMQFQPATKDGAPVAVQVSLEFDCGSAKASRDK